MVDNQHQQISGYRDMSEADINIINLVKDVEGQVAEVWKAVGEDSTVDLRWMAVARTHFQEGFSALVRAIAKPADPFTDLPVKKLTRYIDKVHLDDADEHGNTAWSNVEAHLGEQVAEQVRKMETDNPRMALPDKYGDVRMSDVNAAEEQFYGKNKEQ